MLLEILGWCLAVGAVAGSVIQLLKLRHDVAGVSIVTYTAWGWSWLCWAVISIHEGYWSKAVTELSGALVEGAVVVALVLVAVKLRKNWWKGIAVGSLMLVGAVLSFLSFGVTGALIFLTIAEAAAIGPQVWDATKPDRGGISTSAWVVSAVMASGWVLYGYLNSNLLPVGWAVVFAPAAAFIAWRAHTYKPAEVADDTVSAKEPVNA